MDAPADPKPVSGLALWAYVLGLLPTGVVSLPLGWLALRRIRGRGDRVGRPVAWGAMGLGLIWWVGLGYLVFLRVASGAAAYEDAALHELRSLRAAQSAFHTARVIDTDGDAIGEFGDFAALAGRDAVSLEYRKIDAQGVVRRYGYCFRCYLPIGADARELGYLVYAWPDPHGDPAVRAFLLDGRSGQIYACSNATHISGRYSAGDRIPLVLAAFDPARSLGNWPQPGLRPGDQPADGEDWALLE